MPQQIAISWTYTDADVANIREAWDDHEKPAADLVREYIIHTVDNALMALNDRYHNTDLSSDDRPTAEEHPKNA